MAYSYFAKPAELKYVVYSPPPPVRTSMASKPVKKEVSAKLQNHAVVPMTLRSAGAGAMLALGAPIKLLMALVLMMQVMPGLEPDSLDMVELFAGQQAISKAALALNLAVRSMDIDLSKSHDILSGCGMACVPQTH